VSVMDKARDAGFGILGSSLAIFIYVAPQLGIEMPHWLLIVLAVMSAAGMLVGLNLAVFGEPIAKTYARTYSSISTVPASFYFRLLIPLVVAGLLAGGAVRINRLASTIAKMKEPRHLSKAEKDKILLVLATKPRGSFLLQFDIGGAAEAYRYAEELQNFLKDEAHWQPRIISGVPGSVAYPFQGVSIVYRLGSPPPQDAINLRDAFEAAKIPCEFRPRNFVTPEEQWILLIGPKPED